MDVERSHNYASRGVAGTALGLGAGALGLNLLGGGLNGLLGGWNNCGGWNGWGVNCGPNSWAGNPVPVCSENIAVNRYEAGKDARIAELETEIKLRDATSFTLGEMNKMRNYVDDRFNAINNQLCAQAVHNQKTEDSFVLARQDIAAVESRLNGKIAMEAERRCCADNAIVNYANATFYPKMVADVTVGTTTTVQTLYNPIPDCGCCSN